LWECTDDLIRAGIRTTEIRGARLPVNSGVQGRRSGRTKDVVAKALRRGGRRQGQTCRFGCERAWNGSRSTRGLPPGHRHGPGGLGPVVARPHGRALGAGVGIGVGAGARPVGIARTHVVLGMRTLVGAQCFVGRLQEPLNGSLHQQRPDDQGGQNPPPPRKPECVQSRTHDGRKFRK
jgi:hypothetical protein